MAGYSGTPLAKKLGIQTGHRVLLVTPPPGFRRTLGALPEGAEVLGRAPTTRGKPVDVALVFCRKHKDLAERFPKTAAILDPAGGLWVAWPKKASGVPTDLSFDVVQKLGLGAGLVDNKICAVDEVWSGLRFVVRVENRR